MARSKSSGAQGTQPGIANQSRFAALQMDNGDSSDDDAVRLPVPATSSHLAPGTAASSPSKKSLQRQRQKLRKKASNLALDSGAGTDSDISAVVPPQDAPVPPATAFQAQAQGTTSRGSSQPSNTELSSASAASQKPHHHVAGVEPEKSFAEAVKEEAALPRVDDKQKPAPSTAEDADVSTDDAESANGFGDGDEDDESDEDEQAETTAAASATMPKPEPARKASAAQQSQQQHAQSQQGQPEKKQAYTGADHDPKKKIKSIIQRTVWGLAMAVGAIGLVCMGHVYVIALVFIIQAVVFKELTALFDAGYAGAPANEEAKSPRTPEQEAKRKGRKEERERWSRKMAWYFFAVANYYLYGESLIYYFKHILTLQASFLPTAYTFAQHHRLISFGLYTIGFVSFVATLNRNSLRRQFSLFGWIHMSLLLIVVSSHFIVNNILEGMIWFWVPISLVIVNDVAAYVCGMLFGRHQLIKLSPKKTVEGFVGALFVTMIFAYFWGTFFMRFDYMRCPVQDLSTNVLSDIHCQPNHVFQWYRFPIPASITALLETFTGKHFDAIPYAPFQLHSIVLAAFASLVAPFGGFFASGFKRAAGIKDFGNSLPGHGGFLDRMDCQFLMGLFTSVYYSSLIREVHFSPSAVLAAFATLPKEQQVEVLGILNRGFP